MLKILFVVLMLFVFPLQAVSENQKIYMTLTVAKDSRFGEIAHLFFEELFSHVGIELNIINCPPVQCTLYIKQGVADGALARTEYFNGVVEDLLKVPAKIGYANYAAYYTKPEYKLLALSDLKTIDATVAIATEDHALNNHLLPYAHSGLSIVNVSHWREGINKLITD